MKLKVLAFFLATIFVYGSYKYGQYTYQVEVDNVSYEMLTSGLKACSKTTGVECKAYIVVIPGGSHVKATRAQIEL